MSRSAFFPPRPRVPVAIVGGGYSGTILAAKLARRGVASVLIDGSGRMGRGLAYSTPEPAHLLNVRAERMSAFADAPDHFARYFAASGGDARGFARRSAYGEYLDTILTEAIASGRVSAVARNAIAARREDDGWRIDLGDGEAVEAAILVLAIGNQRPAAFDAFRAAGNRYVPDPWGDEARSAIVRAGADDRPVLLIGTGLTMVDAVLSLHAAGHCGRIVAVSRRGQSPLAHADFTPAPVEASDLPLGNLLGLWRWLRRRSAAVGWQAAIDSLRPHSQRIWQSLDGDHQRRFLRHARPFWDVRRHRIAPQVAAILADRVQSGSLKILAGRIGRVEVGNEGLQVELRLRGGRASRWENFALAINCTGPLHTLARTDNPLLRDLLNQRVIAPDALGIGVALGDGARVAGADDLWAIGPLTKGRYWEITAVPDIRDQAADIAGAIVERLENDERYSRQSLRSR